MKRLNPFETSIIGFFIGVITAAYLLFLTTTESFLGVALKWVSLVPVENVIKPIAASLALQFLFVVAVYTLYGFLVGVIIKYVGRVSVVIGIIALAVVVIATDQYNGMRHAPKRLGADVSAQAAVVRSVKKNSNQYFGPKEARGDLNADGIEDVAFLIIRNDTDRGELDYVSTALGTSRGNEGTNLVFLGDNIKLENILIENGEVVVEYSDGNVTSASDNMNRMFFHIQDGVLQKVEKKMDVQVTSKET